MIKKIPSFLILLSLFLLFYKIANASDLNNTLDLIFSVMGDVPRSASEDTLLQKQISAQNKYSKSEFMVHVGDIKSGGMPCDENVYIKVSGYLKKLQIPTFIVPGDNEWNDCDDPVQAWSFWEKYFLRFEKNRKLSFAVQHQSKRPENFSFVKKNVLIIGINLVGGRVFDEKVWNQVLQADADWVKNRFQKNAGNVYAAVICAQANPKSKHDLFMTQFRKAAKAFAKPVLFIHGDGHKWIYTNPWLESNIVRVQVDRGGIAPPVQVTVSPNETPVFKFERKPFPVND
ncbi:MAG: hypothetical protein GXO75_20810 [Calditrichaeota bacterium]|nr:hypothetical protein [Calditrichota bacterium]